MVRSALAILLTLAACHDPDVERMAAIQQTVCACKTASCAEQEMKRVPSAAIKSTHRTQELARELLDCLSRLQSDERLSTDPDDEQAPDTEPGAARPAPSGPRTGVPASAETR
jgi:hypothetical protein